MIRIITCYDEADYSLHVVTGYSNMYKFIKLNIIMAQYIITTPCTLGQSGCY
jgi:hypothetical protein